MHAAQFVEAYPLDLTPEVIHAGEHATLIHEPQEWSYKFGRRLYTDLAGMEPDSLLDYDELTPYWRWMVDEIHDLEAELMIRDDEPGFHALNELNFHHLNGAMFGLWEPIRKGAWSSDGTRQHRIGATERSLAKLGFINYMTRQESVDEIGAPTWIEGEFKGIHRSLTGRTQEYDAALVLMGVMRQHPSITIVPAPLNFERTKKRTNVDFLAFEQENRGVVGIQVKTNVRDHDYQKADQDRVVFIDGTVDLANVMAMRTRKISSNIRPTAWAGIIAAKMLETLSPNKFGIPFNPRHKNEAKRLVGNIRVDYSHAVALIGERILSKL